MARTGCSGCTGRRVLMMAIMVVSFGINNPGHVSADDSSTVLDLDGDDELDDNDEWEEWLVNEDEGGGEFSLSMSSPEAWAVLRDERASSLSARPPIFLLPGIASTRLVNWREKQCSRFGSPVKPREVVWVNIGKLVESVTYDKWCWVDCMKLGPRGVDFADVNGSSAGQCSLRPDEGLDAVSVLAPGMLTSRLSQVFSPLIDMLVEQLGYQGGRSLMGAPYDWRLAPRRLEERDAFFTKLKADIERAVQLNRRPAIIIAHSMGNLVVQYFVAWLEATQPRTWRAWIDRHLWCYVGLGAPLLGAVGALKPTLTGETFGLSISEAQAREMELTFDSTHFLNPRKIHSRRHTHLRGRWPREMVRIRPDAASNRSVSFGINEVNNGHIFKWLAERAVEAKEEDAAAVTQKHRALKTEYWDDELIPSGGGKGRGGGRGLGPPKRPPIRHVIMAYGVDLPTDIGYRFVHVNASGRGGLLLEESVEETAGGAVWAVRHRDGLSLSEGGAGGGGGVGREEERDGRGTGGVVVAAEARERKRLEKERRKREKERKKQELQATKRGARRQLRGPNGEGRGGTSGHSGDGVVPYTSLAYAHTWLEEDAAFDRDRRTPSRLHGNASSATQSGGGAGAGAAVGTVGTSGTSTNTSSGWGFFGVGRKDAAKQSVATAPKRSVWYRQSTSKVEPERCRSIGGQQRPGFTGGPLPCLAGRRTTTVLELDGVQHRDATNDPALISAVMARVLFAMDEDLCLGCAGDGSGGRGPARAVVGRGGSAAAGRKAQQGADARQLLFRLLGRPKARLQQLADACKALRTTKPGELGRGLLEFSRGLLKATLALWARAASVLDQVHQSSERTQRQMEQARNCMCFPPAPA